MGDTLRGLLLYGYAFATIGTIAGYAAIVAFAGAARCSCWSGSASGTHAVPATPWLLRASRWARRSDSAVHDEGRCSGAGLPSRLESEAG